MGTEIALEIGGLTVDWCKNSMGTDHGALFQDNDRKARRSDQIDYDYFRENDEDPGPMELAFCRPLREVVPRIELLGFTLEQVEREYLERAEIWLEECQEIAEMEEEEPVQKALSFAEFREFATMHSVLSLDNTFISSIDARSQARVQGRFTNTAVLQRLPHYSEYEQNAYSERSYFGGLIGFMHPYSVLRVLAENTANLDVDVVWQYGPLVEAGYAGPTEFVPHARRDQTFLIATEGSSDTHILGHALSLLKPEISDFFRFIDVSERHPFPGTGNLLKFAEGLVKIDVHNQVVFLFDNDAEGFDAYQRLSRLDLPPNMRPMILPEMDQFRAFPAQGPEGVTRADINRRAAAIECYLDLEVGDYPPASIVWTNYKKELDLYHGALKFKETYTKDFMKQTAETIANGCYDVSKLRVVLDALAVECSALAVAA